MKAREVINKIKRLKARMYNDACTIKYLKRRLIDGKFKVVKKFPKDDPVGHLLNSVDRLTNNPWRKAGRRAMAKKYEEELRRAKMIGKNSKLNIPSWDEL